jgi:DNA gyrase subunit B
MATEDKKRNKEDKYDASSITVLEGLEAVRKRPGMYIGTTGPDGLHHLIWEIFDNSRDEAMNGRCSRIEIALLPEGYVRIADNGRGIPVGIHPKTKISALETVLTVLHAGGKFGDGGYTVSGGLHGVGASVVNALSIHLRAEVHQDGGKHMQEYVIGKPKSKVKQVAKSKEHGTVITFKPDAEIFKEGVIFDYNKIVSHVRQQAYLVKGLQITVIDARDTQDNIIEKLREEDYFFSDSSLDAPSKTFYFEGGLKSLVAFYNYGQKVVHDNIFYIEKKVEGVESVEIALQYIDDISPRITGFANNIYNPEGGTHITGFKTSLTRTINTYARKANLIKENDDNFSGDDVAEGLTAVVSVKLREIQFEGQTKAKLGSTEAQTAVATVFGEAFSSYLEENPDDARAIINKSILALRARKAAKAAKDSVLRKGALEGMTLPGKLADCQSKSAEESELFIVEGDSAGGTAKTGRDRRTQAILPLRGKILNVERARLDKMLSSEQVKNLVIALGTAIGDTFDIGKLRYHKIIIATDADVDGAHIRTLILTLFYRYFPKLVEGGYIYIAQSPLYKIKKGKEITYLYSDDEKQKFMSKEKINLEETMNDESDDEGEEENTNTQVKKNQKIHVQRYKGLGEMNADELWETTMDPKMRILKKVTIDDGAEANSVFDMLMGTDVPARKSFIQSNAKLANLDI